MRFARKAANPLNRREATNMKAMTAKSKTNIDSHAFDVRSFF
jgi:hypothetical protein